MPTPSRPSRFRLSPDVRPSHYDLHLHPDLDAGTFRGSVRIAVDLVRPRRDVVLHALELAIDGAGIEVNGDEIPARATLQRADDTVTLRPSRPLPKGAATLVLRFHGKLSLHLRGLYAASSGGVPYAFTQCEAADARRIFPCFDEPAFKARITTSVTARTGDSVLSNAPIAREEPAGAGARTVHFEPTPPLSTYLFALAVGPLESSEARSVGDTPIRVWHVPGKAHLSAFGLEAGVESLRRLEAYFGLPYPYAKLDLVAVPDFEAGAMENAGAVFFRETLLLLDPATVSVPELKRAAEVIAHELAHMWYGDLVTMAWWDDLWLNEAFATWMAFRVVDEWKPEWRMWQTYEHDRAAALGLDALTSTHPIYAPVHSVAQATENFDVITYEKGAAVVRMIEHWLGADTFRDGVRRYMERHRESNAVAADLWRALADASGRDVARVAQSWIAQPGFPLVRLTPAAGGLAAKQDRFFADPKVPAEKRRSRWPVPLVVKVAPARGEPRVERLLVDKASQQVPVQGGTPRWFFGNAAAGGFYRVLHDPTTHAALLADLQTALTPVERMAFVGDQWALVRANRDQIDAMLDLIDVLGDEPSHDVLDCAAGPLAVLDDQVVEPGSALQTALRAWVARRFGPAFAALGWDPAGGEDDAVRLRRAALLRLVGGIAESPAVLSEARRRLDGYLLDRGSLEPNLADSVVAQAARVGDDALHARYLEVIAAARTPQERRRFLLSLPVFRTPSTIRRTLDVIFTPAVPTQDIGFVLIRLFANPDGRDAAWKFLKTRWSTLKKRIPPLMIPRLVDSTPSLREPRFAREVREFFGKQKLPEAARALRQSAERFRLNAELRRRTAPGLERWLARHE